METPIELAQYLGDPSTSIVGDWVTEFCEGFDVLLLMATGGVGRQYRDQSRPDIHIRISRSRLDRTEAARTAEDEVRGMNVLAVTSGCLIGMLASWQSPSLPRHCEHLKVHGLGLTIREISETYQNV